MMIMRLRSFWLAKEQGFRVQLAPKCTEMRKRLAAKQIDLIVPDVMLLKGNELDLCRDLRSKRWNVPIMLLTAQGGRGSICAAARDQQHHPFAAEVRRLMLAVPYGRSFVCYSRRARATRWVRISMVPVTCRDRSSKRSASRESRMSTSAGRLAS
jgi:CheY-like chemotaxis protein